MSLLQPDLVGSLDWIANETKKPGGQAKEAVVRGEMNGGRLREDDLFQQVRTAAAEVHLRRFCAAKQIMYRARTEKKDRQTLVNDDSGRRRRGKRGINETT